MLAGNSGRAFGSPERSPIISAIGSVLPDLEPKFSFACFSIHALTKHSFCVLVSSSMAYTLICSCLAFLCAYCVESDHNDFDPDTGKKRKLTIQPPPRLTQCQLDKAALTGGSGSASGQKKKASAGRSAMKGKSNLGPTVEEVPPNYNTVSDITVNQWRDLRRQNPYLFPNRTYQGADKMLTLRSAFGMTFTMSQLVCDGVSLFLPSISMRTTVLITSPPVSSMWMWP